MAAAASSTNSAGVLSSLLPLLLLLIMLLSLHFTQIAEAATFFGSHNKTSMALENERVKKHMENLHKHAVDDPEEVVAMVHESIRNATLRRKLEGGVLMNPIDACLSKLTDRRELANCAIGFGSKATGGRDGKMYTVTDPSDHDPVNPSPGTLRYAVIQDEPLWIVFARDMKIVLTQELIVNHHKTIDGNGKKVHITRGAGFTIQFVTNVIIHGLIISDIIPTGNANVRSSPTHFGWRTKADGDAISIFGSSHVWVDHNTLSNCADGLVDAVMSSTAITISNNLLTNHNEVMLMGHSDGYEQDKNMQVTIAFNHFGEGLVQRMPRVRHGYFHVVNNDYTHWEMYAIGGSANPTVNSQGNRFVAPNNRNALEVTKHNVGNNAMGTSSRTSLPADAGNWRTEGDKMVNGAFFVVAGSATGSTFARASSLGAMPVEEIDAMTAHAGAYF